MSTAPGAASQIAATAGLTGTYQVTVSLYIDGTSSGSDDDNMGVRYNSSTYQLAITPSAGAAVVQYTFVATLASSTIAVRAINAGGAAAVYHASIIATPMGKDS